VSAQLIENKGPEKSRKVKSLKTRDLFVLLAKSIKTRRLGRGPWLVRFFASCAITNYYYIISVKFFNSSRAQNNAEDVSSDGEAAKSTP
jgi:hypothetical protein